MTIPLRWPARLAPLTSLASLVLCATLTATPAAHATGMDPFMGEVMLFATSGGWCPRGWLAADGTQLPISQYSALFSLLGTTYGGNGTATFALPDLRGRTPVGQGQGTGLPNYTMGQVGGQENATLLNSNMPAHTHALPASTAPATHAAPATGRVPAQAQNAGVYASGGTTVDLAPTGMSGQGLPFSIRNPYLVMQWCIAVEGIYPTRQ